jgi:predicted HAD superfamily Cof-like phosphohydrolase
MDDLTDDELKEYADLDGTGTWGDVMPAMARELLRRRHTPNLFSDVAAFNKKFGLPTTPGQRPRLLPEALWTYRCRFAAEEGAETTAAWFAGDIEGVIDGLVDRIYVDLGTLHFMGVPFDDHWQEVQRANMSKIKGPSGKGRTLGLAGIDESFEVRKPAGWLPPDHARVLREHIYIHHDKTQA